VIERGGEVKDNLAVKILSLPDMEDMIKSGNYDYLYVRKQGI
jgi:hypothetical protein